jgi:hypothetical protein
VSLNLDMIVPFVVRTGTSGVYPGGQEPNASLSDASFRCEKAGALRMPSPSAPERLPKLRTRRIRRRLRIEKRTLGTATASHRAAEPNAR